MSSKVLVNRERYGEYENDGNNEALINLIRRKSNSRRQQHREAEECQEGWTGAEKQRYTTTYNDDHVGFYSFYCPASRKSLVLETFGNYLNLRLHYVPHEMSWRCLPGSTWPTERLLFSGLCCVDCNGSEGRPKGQNLGAEYSLITAFNYA